MIRIGILGNIGSGKSYVARNFGYPVFNADYEVAQLYRRDKKIFTKLKKSLPKYIHSFPIQKEEISDAILTNKNNLNKIVKIVHTEVRKKMNNFLNKNKNKKIIILDIPLLLENKISKKKDILVFVQSKQSDIIKQLKKRKNFNQKLFKKFKAIQYSNTYKKKKSHFIIKNDFTKKSVNTGIKNILNELNR
ncbi:dephospho-CoA kinase [Candidatus Pelagibacter bacterium nBUS_28]|uniref:dephospho-CoA kinase n=1 Tax=Candidatus Pelagibacter bacterium nBUS_28 TaxID=3374189 RepID=UPI003EB9442C